MANLIDTLIVTGPNFEEKPASTFIIPSVTTGIVASTTQTIAGATQLTATYNNITKCANGSDAVKLSPLVIGQAQWVFNNGAAAASVFPYESTTKIDGGSAGAAATVTNAKQAMFLPIDATNIVSLLGGSITKAS